VESGKNYKTTRFVSSKRQCVNAASNPRFNRMIPIHDTLAFVMLDRAKRRCARPVAVAQTVLDQAKLVFLRDLHEHIFKLCPPEFVEFGKRVCVC
jgi:ureidoglycolate hydrolase